MGSSNNLEIKHTSTVVWVKFPDNSKAYIKYEVRGDRILVLETYTPPQHRGKGVARKLMEYILRLAQERNLLIEPVCSYSIYYFIKNPDKRDLLVPEYRRIDLEELWRKRVEEEGKKQ